MKNQTLLSTQRALLPGLKSFLLNDLDRETLSVVAENKRRALLERLEVLAFGPCPPIPDSPVDAVPTALPETQSHAHSPLSKRYSLPPSISGTSGMCRIVFLALFDDEQHTTS
ncbi:unnamed protein product [Dibothriocephalus latus]|uniref:Uncharacterized protein n=1 Tax=Dibothriocephalus latus TaxID=60516 RepID=A0A3P7NJ14_DIBLA|nr:unnamed protein product [Dibothriocephalus latus]